MDESNLLQSLGQVSSGEAAEIFRDHLRGCVRELICEVMASEVTELCGPKHSPSGGEIFRSGSSPGRVIFEGQREDVVRPRVRERQANGSTTEVSLASYESARNPERLRFDLGGVDGRRQHTGDQERPARSAWDEQVERISPLAAGGP